MRNYYVIKHNEILYGEEIGKLMPPNPADKKECDVYLLDSCGKIMSDFKIFEKNQRINKNNIIYM